MNTPTRTPSAQEEAGSIINGTIQGLKEKGKLSPQEIREKLEPYRKDARAQTAKLIGEYVNGLETLQDETPQAKIEDLPEQVGGQFDGSKVTIAEETLNVRGDIHRTVTAMEETARHEAYHEEHGHTKPIVGSPDKKGDTLVTINGKDFNDTQLHEGMTVHATGDETVSTEYVAMEHALEQAVAAEGMDMEQVEEAIDNRDVSVLDDEAPETEGADKPEFALAA
jgi:hypothetical protein